MRERKLAVRLRGRPLEPDEQPVIERDLHRHGPDPALPDDDAGAPARGSRFGSRERGPELEADVRLREPAERAAVAALERVLHPARGRERVCLPRGSGEDEPVLGRRVSQRSLQRRLGVRARPLRLGAGDGPGADGERQDEEDERRPDGQPSP